MSVHCVSSRVCVSARACVCIYRTIDNPKCGFSQETLKLLEGTGSAFTCIDVLDEEANPGVREAVKQIAMWPTIPQVRTRVLSTQ